MTVYRQSRCGARAGIGRWIAVAGLLLTTPCGATLVGSAPTILEQLSASWIGAYAAHHPVTTPSIARPLGPPQGRLSPPLEAFLEAKLDFAFLTRDLASSDRQTFLRFHRREAIVLPVAGGAWHGFGFVDPVVVIVNAANPIRRLSFRQLDALLSESRLRGGAPIRDWSDLGVLGWRGRPVHIVGGDAWADEESARAQTMRRLILDGREQAGRWVSVPNSGSEADVVARVAADPLAIGFTGLGHIGPGVRAIALSVEDGGRAIAPRRRAILAARYPLVRTVDLLLVADEKGCPTQEALQFAHFLLGREGQAIIARAPPFERLAPRQIAASRGLLQGCQTKK